jgi:hypothetical protein
VLVLKGKLLKGNLMSTTNDDIERLRKKPGRASRTAATASVNGTGWKQRKIETLACPSGQVVQVRRPGPDFMLRAGRVVKTFSKELLTKPKNQGEISEPERGLTFVANMNDEEFAAMMAFARELVCAMLVSPKLVQHPRPGTDEVGPDDIGDDFWYLFGYAVDGFSTLPVPVANQEVEVGDLESFRQEPGVSGDSTDGAEVRTDAEQPAAGQGLVGGV